MKEIFRAAYHLRGLETDKKKKMKTETRTFSQTDPYFKIKRNRETSLTEGRYSFNILVPRLRRSQRRFVLYLLRTIKDLGKRKIFQKDTSRTTCEQPDVSVGRKGEGCGCMCFEEKTRSDTRIIKFVSNC